MKKLLILSIAILPFLGSCDKDNGNDEPEPGVDPVPTVDTLIEPVYLEFYEYGKSPIPIRFDSLVSLYPNDKFWFWGNWDLGLIDAWVERGVDTIVEGKPCVKIYSAYLYTYGMAKNWNFKQYKEQAGLGETQIGGKDAGTIGGWSFLMRYYEKGELVFECSEAYNSLYLAQ